MEKNPAGGQPTIWTSYDYDPLKQITAVTDDHGNVTRAEYDNLGRMTALDSPDAGRTAFTFDLASNLIAKQTANLRAEDKCLAEPGSDPGGLSSKIGGRGRDETSR